MIEIVANKRQTSGKLDKRQLSNSRIGSHIHEQANGARLAFRRVKEYRKQRPSSIRDDIVDVPSHQQKADQEDEACEDSNANASQHDSWSLDGWIRNLFNLVHSEKCSLVHQNRKSLPYEPQHQTQSTPAQLEASPAATQSHPATQTD